MDPNSNQLQHHIRWDEWRYSMKNYNCSALSSLRGLMWLFWLASFLFPAFRKSWLLQISIYRLYHVILPHGKFEENLYWTSVKYWKWQWYFFLNPTPWTFVNNYCFSSVTNMVVECAMPVALNKSNCCFPRNPSQKIFHFDKIATRSQISMCLYTISEIILLLLRKSLQ